MSNFTYIVSYKKNQSNQIHKPEKQEWHRHNELGKHKLA